MGVIEKCRGIGIGHKLLEHTISYFKLNNRIEKNEEYI